MTNVLKQARKATAAAAKQGQLMRHRWEDGSKMHVPRLTVQREQLGEVYSLLKSCLQQGRELTEAEKTVLLRTMAEEGKWTKMLEKSLAELGVDWGEYLHKSYNYYRNMFQLISGCREKGRIMEAYECYTADRCLLADLEQVVEEEKEKTTNYINQ